MKVAIVTITYKRPEGLRKLLRELMCQEIRNTPIEELNIIVVDNDPDGSASLVVSEFPGNGAIKVTCLSEKRQGIPIARNRGMQHAIEGNEYFAFIDDDEYPTPRWIHNLLAVAIELDSDCVLAPVRPVFLEGTPQWVRKSRVFEGWNHVDRSRIWEAASNNVLVRSEFVRSRKMEFDERMQATGGSDYRFFRQCVESGMIIHWSSEAFVFEDIPRSRTQLRWIAQRQIRLGNTFAVDARLSRSLPRIAKLYSIGVARSLFGIFALPTFLISSRLGTNALVHLLRGVGILSGIHGYRHDEYAKQRLDNERATN